MVACHGKLSNHAPCPKEVQLLHLYCRWHDPLDETWRDIYLRLEKATPEEKVDIVLEVIEDHPEHFLILPEIDGVKADLSGIDLSRETLERNGKLSKLFVTPGAAFNPTLRKANLQGALLERANLQGIDLHSANLASARLWDIDLRSASLFGANLEGAQLDSAKLQGAYLAFANLHDAKLGFTDLSDAKFRYTKFGDAFLGLTNLTRADFNDTNLENIDFSETNLSNAFFGRTRLGNTRMERDQLGGAIGEELDRNYSAAKRGYLSLKQNFDDLGDYEAASWAYRKERRMEKLDAREKGGAALKTYEEEDGERKPKERNWKKAASGYFKYVSDTFVEWLCDYGESVWRVIGWMAVLLFIVGPLLFSVMGGFVWGEVLARDFFSISSPLDQFWFSYRLYLLYTLDALTTASFSGLRPANDAVKFASGFFAIAGIVLAGLLGFVAGNRIRRS